MSVRKPKTVTVTVSGHTLWTGNNSDPLKPVVSFDLPYKRAFDDNGLPSKLVFNLLHLYWRGWKKLIITGTRGWGVLFQHEVDPALLAKTTRQSTHDFLRSRDVVIKGIDQVREELLQMRYHTEREMAELECEQ